jgi:TPR repeat protein
MPRPAEPGQMYRKGRGVLQSDELASLVLPRLRTGLASAVAAGRSVCAGAGREKERCAGLAWFRKAALQGDAQAQLNLGLVYKRGQGVAQSDAQAVAWFRQAAAQGLAVAQRQLGVAYGRAWRGARPDARLCLAAACGRTGRCGRPVQPGRDAGAGPGRGQGRGARRRLVPARRPAGHCMAQYNLGGMYAGGRGIARDLRQALEWYAGPPPRRVECPVQPGRDVRQRPGRAATRPAPCAGTARLPSRATPARRTTWA